MLPRVSAALAQFIAPIATSGKQDQPNRQAFERFAPAKKREREPGQGNNPAPNPGAGQQSSPAPEGAKVIPFPAKESSPSPSASPALPSGISQALLQLMNLLQEQRATIMRWLGPGVYQSAARQQKKNGRARKGTILDEKAE